MHYIIGNFKGRRWLEEPMMLSPPYEEDWGMLAQNSPDISLASQTDDNGVEIVAGLGEWFVHVNEKGQTVAHSFELEDYAVAYAEGQRIRLSLKKVTRV